MHQAKRRCLASDGSAASAAKPCGRRQFEPVEIERAAVRLEERSAGVPERSLSELRGAALGRPQIERAGAVARTVEQIDAQRIEREIERDLEIRPRDAPG